MKIKTVILLFSLSLNLPGQNIKEDRNFKQIITSQTIKESGITSISDILSLVNGIHFSSIDGITGTISLNNLSSYQRQNILILVDGQETETELFDIENLNLLPLSLEEIDYIEIINTPAIHRGDFAEGGIIHFHTHKSVKGISVHAAHVMGDETGDPGPLTFTEYKSANVDRLAQYYSIGAEAAGANWFVKASRKHEESNETDPAISGRISHLNNRDNKAILVANRINLGTRFFNGDQLLTLSESVNNDFFFFKPYGNEIPIREIIQQISFSGDAYVGKFGINYFGKYSLHKLGYLQNNQNIDFDFSTVRFSIGAEFFYSSSMFKAMAGFSNNSGKIHTSSPVIDEYIAINNLYLQSTFLPAKNFTQSIVFFVATDNKNYAAKLSLANQFTLNNSHEIISNLSFIQTLFEEDNNLWVWQQKGYKLNLAEDNYFLPGNLNSRELITADLGYRFRIDSLSYAEAGINFRSFSNYYVEEFRYQLNQTNNTFSSGVKVFNDQELSIMSIYTALNYHITPGLSATITYYNSSTTGGSQLFKEQWKAIPMHTGSLSISYRPFSNYGLSGRIRYTGSSEWYDYRNVDFQSDSRYKMKINSIVLADISSYLWLWQKRIWVNGVIKNLFNQPEMSHPIGADFDFRFYLQLHLYFESILF